MRADRGTRVLSTKPEEAGVGDAEVRPDQEAQGGPILLTGSGETCCLLQPWAQREGRDSELPGEPAASAGLGAAPSAGLHPGKSKELQFTSEKWSRESQVTPVPLRNNGNPVCGEMPESSARGRPRAISQGHGADFFFSWPHCMTCGILGSLPGINPGPQQGKTEP